MIAPTRRAALAGLLATTLAPRLDAAKTPVTKTALDALLDRAATLPPRAGIALLDGIDRVALGDGARLDLLTARAGLACDAALATLGAPGRSPYRISPRAGVWQRATDPAAIDAEREAVVADATRGIVLPRAVLDDTVAAIKGRDAAPDVTAALQRLADALTALRERAPPPGMRHLPHGASWYALLLRRHGVRLTPEAADRLLAREETRLERRAQALFATRGDRAGALGDRYRRLWRDTRHHFPDNARGRARAVADMNDVLATIRTALRGDVPDVPSWPLDVAVRGMNAAELAAGLQGFRQLPTPTIPGAYVIDLRRIAARPRWTLPSVVAHELLPGHLLQMPLEAGAPPHTLRLEYAAGFSEGWAIHAEELAARRGWLGDDPLVMLGHLHWLLFRVCRARADLAIHWRGSSVAQVRGRFEQMLGEPVYFIDFATDIGRIIVEPGVRVAEATSWLAIRERMARRPGRLIPFLRAGRRRDEQISAAP